MARAALIFVASRSVIEIWTGSDQGDKYLVVGLTAVAQMTYGLLRFVEFLASPGFRTRYLVRSLNVGFMGVILLGEYLLSSMLGRVLVLLALIAIEINLVSMFAEYTGRFKRLSGMLRRGHRPSDGFIRSKRT